jgi:rubrerythrin
MKHIHHIIPRHMGGSDDPSNLVELTIEQHAAAHLELYEKYGKIQDEIAYRGLSGLISMEEARRLAVSAALTGVSKTDTHRANISKSQKERYNRLGCHPNKGGSNPPCSDERKRKISEANRGKSYRSGYSHTEETKKAMSESCKNRPMYTCPKCGTSMQKQSIARHHGINGEKCDRPYST